MSKREFLVVSIEYGVTWYNFNIIDVFNKFQDLPQMHDTELSYTLEEDIDFLMDLKVNETVHYYEDRDKKIPCLLKRIS